MGLFGIGNKKKQKNQEKPEKKTAEQNKKQKNSPENKKQKPLQNKINIDEKLEEGYILCRSIIEILGIPKEHVEKTLKDYVDQISKNKNYDIIKKEFSETKEHGDETYGKLYGLFVELELLAKNTASIIDFCFDYMPSSLEIVEPEKIVYNANELSGMFNDLQARMHEMDKIVKTLKIQNKNLEVNSSALLRNLIIVTAKEKPKTLKEISNQVGVPEEQLKPFMEKIVKEGFLEEKNKKYSSVKK